MCIYIYIYIYMRVGYFYQEKIDKYDGSSTAWIEGTTKKGTLFVFAKIQRPSKD